MTDEMLEISVESSIDKTLQPNLFYEAKEKNRPLLVGLHTWSHNRFNQVNKMLPLAKKNEWNLLLPEFRGPNTVNNPISKLACGSECAKQDIIDAVNYVKANYDIDENNILLLGASGGGHMALLMAAYKPELWKAVASFVPISDVSMWHSENENYRRDIEACCGDINSKESYDMRSPINYAEEISKATVKIYSGKWDKIVPCHHGLDMFVEIFKRFPDANVFFEMFDGGHEMVIDDAERWFVKQMDNSKKGETVTG